MDCLRGNNLPAFVTFHFALLEPGVSTLFIFYRDTTNSLQTGSANATSIPAYDRAICIIGQEATKVGPTERYALCVNRDTAEVE
jgi:hypothetical protein